MVKSVWLEGADITRLETAKDNAAFVKALFDDEKSQRFVESFLMHHYKIDNLTGGVDPVMAKDRFHIMTLMQEESRLFLWDIFKNDKEKSIGHLTVNVCGFSRGAAAARHFVARRTSEFFPQYPSLSGSLGIPPAKITINFVGLFDTVSSYGGEKHKNVVTQTYNNVKNKSFDDDVDELHLAIGANAKQVVQLAAADEYRKNFASTNILSSVRAKVGLEVKLPGVHSDVGGSYEEKKEERRWITSFEKKRLIEEGWYTTEQLPIGPNDGWWSEGVRVLTNAYQFIPLAIMVDLAQQSAMQFHPFEGKYAAYQVPGPLQGLAAAMHGYVLGRPAPRSMKPYEPAQYVLPDQYKWVRNQYLHRSAIQGSTPKANLTMGGRYVNRLPSRQIIPDSTAH
ncbi:MAG: hypothetical protein EOO63_06215 [Hymenobacter sp.]|nr:MAG: hypothetical protein EOO63_06215 [Hymenobacter sp.]